MLAAFRPLNPCRTRAWMGPDIGQEDALSIGMLRAVSFVALLLVSVAPQGVAQTQVENLARVLRDKQIISSSDYDRIVHESPGEELALLTTILRDKGILSSADIAGIG